ncbi:hypothetical protein DIPPA_13676 [Diplonema papillatum]|nr:hypothetical protein DIPPA_13676 [Diplonema papillatum]
MPGKQKKPKKATYTANQLFMAFLVFTGSFLLFAVWPDSREAKHYDAYITSLGVKRGRLETTCTGSGDERTCYFVAKKNIDAGERVVSIPITSILNVANIMQDEGGLKSIVTPEGSDVTIRDLFISNGFSSEYLFPSFAMTFKFWWEKKLGSASSMAGYIDLMPKKPEHALFFSDEEATCLDKASFEERNSSLTNVKGFASIAMALCKGKSDYPCTVLDPNTAVAEFKWAYASVMQRIWGDVKNPMIIPVVDFAFPHPELCAPASVGGDGDERCIGRNKQFFLQPKQESEEMLVMLAQSMAMKGDRIYSLSTQRAPWETLVTYGYADYAANMIPDLLFLSQFHKFTFEHKVDLNTMATDYPLKNCGDRTMMSWSQAGVPKKELRDCWAAMFWFFEHPQHIAWTETAIDEYQTFLDNQPAVIKYKFLAWSAIASSAENVAAYVVSNRGPHCEEKTGHLPVIKAATDITRGIFQRAISYGAKKKTDAFTKWQKVDETADKDIPLPQAPVKEHVDETAEETFDEADISNQEA